MVFICLVFIFSDRVYILEACLRLSLNDRLSCLDNPIIQMAALFAVFDMPFYPKSSLSVSLVYSFPCLKNIYNLFSYNMLIIFSSLCFDYRLFVVVDVNSYFFSFLPSKAFSVWTHFSFLLL